MVASYDYDAWGNIIQQNEQGLSVDNPFKYAGYIHDEETNLYYLMARYYHPTHGVFISVDPDPGDADDPITQNGYTYTNNNPVMGVDPDGHAPWLAINAGFAIYDGYKAYKAGKSKTEIAWAVASRFIGIGKVKSVAKVLKAKGPYSHIPDSKTVEKGKNFTPAQKKKILQENMKKNKGVIKSDLSGEICIKPQKSRKGVSPPQNECQIDHINPKSKGGTNSYGNAQVLTRKENRNKSNK